MKSLLVALFFLAGSACADELVVNRGGIETLYEGTLQSVDVEGVNGAVTFYATRQPSTSDNVPPSPPSLGQWSVEVIAGKGRTIVLGNCYPSFAYMANHGARLTLDCAP